MSRKSARVSQDLKKHFRSAVLVSSTAEAQGERERGGEGERERGGEGEGEREREREEGWRREEEDWRRKMGQKREGKCGRRGSQTGGGEGLMKRGKRRRNRKRNTCEEE